MPKRPTTNDNIRDLIDDVRNQINDQRLETKADIRDLARKVDALANKVDKIDKAQAVDATKIGAIVGGISLVVSAIVSVLIESVRNKA